MKQCWYMLLTLFLLTGCGNGNSESTGTPTDSDTDSDVDTDTDSDSDADSDADTETETETDSTPPPGCEGVLSFPDPNLECAIRQAIYMPEGDIYYSDVSGLLDLNADCGS